MKWNFLKLKKVDILLLRSYVGPFAVTFFLSMFLFLMQFLYGHSSQTNFLFLGGFGADGDAADNHGGWFDDFWEFEREF